MRTLEEKLQLPYVLCDLACGLNMHGGKDSDWIHIDADPADGMDLVGDWNDIKLPTESVNELHFSDAIEHVRPWQYDQTFGEINRILKPGALFWGTTPDRSYIIKAAYLKLQDEEWIQRNLYGHSLGYGHTHFTTFTRESLKELLQQYGFVDIEFKPIEWWIHWTCKKG